MSGQYQAGGIKVDCPHCDYDLFEKGKAQLNTAVATFFNLDWANREVETLTCVSCGKIQWFARTLDRLIKD